MNYHPRHCHNPAHHRHRNNVQLKLWTEKNSIYVYEFAPLKKTDSSDATAIYFPNLLRQKSSEDEIKALIHHEDYQHLTDRLKKSPAAKHWEKVGIKHHIGVNVPVFSMKTESSAGIGEYLDLLPLIDWCSSNGLDVIQLLPLNATNPFDNSPFSPISSFSLTPHLLSLTKLNNFDKQDDTMKAIFNQLKDLNSADRVQWPKVIEMKGEWLFKYFSQKEQQEFIESQEYKDWLKANEAWIEGFGLFCYLKEKYEWRHWDEWTETIPENFDVNSQNVMDLDFAKEIMKDENARKSIRYHMFLQFLAFSQMRQVKAAAESKGIFLKGDIPFLVSGDSVDVWLNQKLFIMDKTAGAPPDMFSADGQNWGVPIYNWDNNRKENFTWWKKRLATANQFYHIFRIDHVIGFFRVWAVPKGLKGSDGKFEPSEEKEFIAQGEEVMKMLLENCDMLPIGEDLGTVPLSVRLTLQKLGICGTKVMRWERRWDVQPDQPFIPFDEYNADSMTTVSTHDSETLEQWWKKNTDEANAYCKLTGCPAKANDDAGLTKEQRENILKSANSTPSLFHIQLIPEYLALVPSLIHSDPDQERVNLPGQVADSNWSYRIVPTFETVAANAELSESMKKITVAPQIKGQ